MTCLFCHTPLNLDNDRRRYCGQRCRSRAFRAREEARRDTFRLAAWDLLMRQSQAVRDQDAAALAAVDRDAAILFKGADALAV